MTTLTALWECKDPSALPSFKTTAKYIPGMDCLIYLREDCSYRAVRLNEYTTVLLHPYEETPVGVKFKGVRHLHERASAFLKSLGIKDRPINSLIAFWEMAYADDGDMHLVDAERGRQRMLAKRARAEILVDAEPIADAELALA